MVHTDGNSIAGLLEEIFATEMTAARRVCQSCRRENPVGAHRLYRGAGFVLRCPACDDVAASIAVLPGEHVIHLRGTWTLRRS